MTAGHENVRVGLKHHDLFSVVGIADGGGDGGFGAALETGESFRETFDLESGRSLVSGFVTEEDLGQDAGGLKG